MITSIGSARFSGAGGAREYVIVVEKTGYQTDARAGIKLDFAESWSHLGRIMCSDLRKVMTIN